MLLGGCATLPDLPSGAEAYQAFPPPRPNGELPAYRIDALDKISVTVFQEDELSVKDAQVDASGKILLPLIGEVQAAGRTPPELSADIAQALGRKYLVNPQVSVVVDESVSQKVTVEGSVIEPGVYAIQGRTTLLDAIAMAKGLSRVAKLDDAVIFREVNGARQGALFNLAAIRRGEAPDPEIRGNDAVVVGTSSIKAAWRDVLTAAPLLGAAARY